MHRAAAPGAQCEAPRHQAAQGARGEASGELSEVQISKIERQKIKILKMVGTADS
jgi:hypothetical protein